MDPTAPRKLFVNLAVRDLERSKRFFAELGFAFDPRFSDENAACMVVSERALVMLLVQPFFRTFTRRALCDTSRATEGLFALDCATREEVDALTARALAAGAAEAMPAQDHGFMYGKSFYDPDGHHWEVFWLDPAASKREGAECTSRS